MFINRGAACHSPKFDFLVNSQLGVVGMAGADELAAWAVGGGVPAGALLAPPARPALGAGAGAVHGAARPAVLAPAGLGAVQAEPSVRALFLALKKTKQSETAIACR